MWLLWKTLLELEWALLAPKLTIQLYYLFLKTSALLHRQLLAPVTSEAGAPPVKLFAAWLSLPQIVLTCALKTRVPEQKAVSYLQQRICVKLLIMTLINLLSLLLQVQNVVSILPARL